MIAARSKPRVALDCDGVVTDFTSAALDVAFAISGKRWHHDDVIDWDFARQREGFTPEQNAAFWDAFKRPGFATSLKPYPEAPEVVRKLNEISELRFVTSPMSGSMTWMAERELWLERHLGVSRKQAVHRHDKYTESADIFVDDKPEHVRLWLAHNPLGIGLLWNRPYNAHATDLDNCRISDWSFVIEHATLWRSA